MIFKGLKTEEVAVFLNDLVLDRERELLEFLKIKPPQDCGAHDGALQPKLDEDDSSIEDERERLEDAEKVERERENGLTD